MLLTLGHGVKDFQILFSGLHTTRFLAAQLLKSGGMDLSGNPTESSKLASSGKA